MTITLIGQIRKDHLEIEQKREILQNRGIFWHKTLNTVQANAWTRQWIYVHAVVQFYPWFKCSFLLFQTYYHKLPYHKKRKRDLNQG